MPSILLSLALGASTLFTQVPGIGFLRSSLAGSWIRPRNSPARCPGSALSALEAVGISEVGLPIYGVLRSSARGCGTPQRQEGDVVLLFPPIPGEGAKLIHQEARQ